MMGGLTSWGRLEEMNTIVAHDGRPDKGRKNSGN
jgi:hypothetical protein